MNLMFWKKKKPHEAEEEQADDDKTMVAASDTEEASEENLARPGLVVRLRNIFSALGQRLSRRRNSGTSDEETPGVAEEAGEENAPPPARPNLKKRLIIGGTLGAVVLLLAGIGFAAWKFLFSSHEEKSPAPAEIAAHGSEAPARPAHADGEMQAQLEALKKQNEEMAKQLETLKKEKPQDGKGHEESASTTPENGSSTEGKDEVMVFSGKDPKASAQALKQAIEEMNAASGKGKPRKPAE